MASQTGEKQRDVSATEKPTNSKDAPKTDKAGISPKEEATSEGETVPGWTIMRPLRMRGLKGKKSGSAATVSTNGLKVGGVDSKDNEELKVTETNNSGDRNGIGEVDALHEVRSEDELLGPGDDEASPRRVTANRGLEHNGGENLEGTVSGGTEFKTYKRRWFGLIQLVLLNIIVSWDVSICSIPKCSASPYSMLMQRSGSLSLPTQPPSRNITTSLPLL
jgi:MFS transporter, FLVCR family, MFS-domain-containing protein 7